MIRRTFRGLVQLLGALGAGLAIVMVLLAWRLSSGPISLAFLSPYIEKALSAPDGSFGIRLDDTILTWAGWDRTLDVRVLNVRAVGPGGAAVAVIPELSLSVSAEALLHGVVAPRSIELYRPSLQIVRRKDGSLDVGFGSGEAASNLVAMQLLSRLAAPPDERGPLGYLSRIFVREADVYIIDRQLGTSWHAPNTEIKLSRDNSGIEGEISLNLEIRKRLAHVTLLGAYERKTRSLDFGIDFADIVPAVFSPLSPKLAALESIGVPLKGTLLVSMSLDGTIEAVDFDLTGGQGHFDLPAPFAQRIDVIGLAAKGLYRGEDGALEIENLTLDTGRKGSIVLPDSGGHVLPLRRLSLKGMVSNTPDGNRRIDISSLDAELDGPTLEAKGAIAEGAGGVRVRADAVLRKVPAGQMARYWPKAWGTDAHNWVADHLSKGMVTEARVAVEATDDAKGKFGLVSLKGTMKLDGFTVDYLPPMPKATGVSGTATFNSHRFDITLSTGKAAGLKMTEGKLSFLDLDKYDQIMEVDLTLEGGVRDALGLVDHEPLGLASVIGIDPKQSSGIATTRLKLRFPLLEDLTIQQVAVSAASRMQKVKVADAILGHDINDGDLELRADNEGMTVTGTVGLGTVRGTLDWHENFDPKAKVRTSYKLSGTVDDTQRETELGLDFAPFSKEFMSGPIAAQIDWEIAASGAGTMTASLDLTKAALRLPQFGWAKAPGTTGTADVQMSLVDDKITAVTGFSIKAQDLAAHGSASFDSATGALARIDLDQMKVGRTDVQGTLHPGADGGWTIAVHGHSFDFEPIFGDFFTFEADQAAKKEPAGPDLSFAIDLDQVWIGPDAMISKVQGTLSRQQGVWRAVTLSGLVKGGKPINVRLEPADDGNRKLEVTSEDAGETLRTFGYYDNMQGGSLDITGIFDDHVPGSPLSGLLKVSDFRIIKAPTLAKVVSIMALTGIYDALQGAGLGFSDLEVPFTRHAGVITIKDARVNGASLGFTASGKIYSYSQVMDLQGTVVPAYAINSALGNLPLLGQLFTGGDKGGGVFAATYQMTGPIESPQVTVNPLTVLAPGLLRKLFGLFEEAPPNGEDALQNPFDKP